MTRVLDALPRLDWRDIEAVGEMASAALRELVGRKHELRSLVLEARDDPKLSAMAECHPLDDKIVLYDALAERNFRVRLRLATTYQDERPHNHRFPFTTLIVRGQYSMTWYTTRKPMDESIAPSDIVPIACREEPAGSSSTIDHTAIHSTIATPDCVSLIMRGPTAQERAIICHKESGAVWIRIGAAQENETRRQEVTMTRARFDYWIERLSEQQVI